MIVIKTAWRNIWRNKIRSLVIILAVAIGVWALLFGEAYVNGTTDDFFKNSVEREYAHIQIHHPQFKNNYDVSKTIVNGTEIIESLKGDPQILGISGRAIGFGMINTAKSAMGIQIQGIDMSHEQKVSKLKDKIIEGQSFPKTPSRRKKPILIGASLAEKLSTKVGSKRVTLTLQNAKGETTYIGCEVIGLFKSGSSRFDEGVIYMKQADLCTSIDLEKSIHEIAILTQDISYSDTLYQVLQSDYANLLVEDWKELGPELDVMSKQIAQFTTIFLIIILIALIFGIINTMLMSVLERTKELGMLMAIGMNRSKIFFMILLETIFLSFLGAPFGMFIAYVSVKYFSRYGIDYSEYSKGLEDFGISLVLYLAENDWTSYIKVSLAIITTAIVAAIYPAYKALKLKPVESIRKI